MRTVLETPRLRLRHFQADDLDALSRLYADEEIRRYFPDGTLDRLQTREELDWHLAGGDAAFPDLGLWAVILKSTGAFAGRGGFIPWTIDGTPEVEIAYLIDKALWGQGLGAELAAGLVDHGFAKLGLARLIALVDQGNAASIRTAERAGLAFERDTEIEGQRCRLHAISRP